MVDMISHNILFYKRRLFCYQYGNYTFQHIFGGSFMRSYFGGWYFRCQSGKQTLAIIPSIHKTRESGFCTIQVITDTEAFHLQFPYSDYKKDRQSIRISENQFDSDGITLNIISPGFCACGSIQFGAFTPIRYDIMGPFKYVPFMQCRHSVLSMRHLVNGKIIINGTPFVFQDAIGYIEGDRGYSFPREYVWTQCSFPTGSLMISIADIPFGALRFTGVIGVVLLNGKEYRIATYLGAKTVKITPEEIIVRQGAYTFSVMPQDFSGHPLRAPVSGAMERTIHEHPSCRVYYRFEIKDIPLLELDAPNAAFEYEY